MTIMNQLFRNAIVGKKIFHQGFVWEWSPGLQAGVQQQEQEPCRRFINVHDSIKKKETYSNTSLDKGRGNQLDSAKYKASFKNEIKMKYEK